MTTSLGGPVVAAEKTGATNLKQFVEYAKKVDKVNWGAYGPGSTPHVLVETMAKQYGFKVEVVQYRGEAAMFADVTAQALDGASGSPAAATPVIASGKGRIIAVVGDRLPGWPDVPTMTEAGLNNTQMEASWHGLLAPARTPAPIIARIEKEAQRAVNVPQVREQYAKVELKPVGSSAAEFRAMLVEAIKKLGEIVKIAGIQPE